MNMTRKLREKTEVDNIEDAVKFLAHAESSSIKIVDDGVLSQIGDRSKASGHPERCFRCHRIYEHHHEASPFGNRCKFPVRSLNEQLSWERKKYGGTLSSSARMKTPQKAERSRMPKDARGSRKRKRSRGDTAFLRQIMGEVKKFNTTSTNGNVDSDILKVH